MSESEERVRNKIKAFEQKLKAKEHELLTRVSSIERDLNIMNINNQTILSGYLPIGFNGLSYMGTASAYASAYNTMSQCNTIGYHNSKL